MSEQQREQLAEKLRQEQTRERYTNFLIQRDAIRASRARIVGAGITPRRRF